MDYIIDTNIAYYLSNLSKDENFDINLFKKDKTSKLISSISVLEIYLHYDLETFRHIMKKLNENKIGIVIYGNGINYNNNISLKKLSNKPKSYITRIIKYFESIYLYTISKNIMYLGFLAGGLYCYLLELKDSNKKLKELNLDFISFKTSEPIVLEYIQKDIKKYFETRKKEDCDAIYSHSRLLVLMSIASYKCKNYDTSIRYKYEQEEFEKIVNMELDCFGLMQETCKKRGFKSSDIIKKFYEDLGNSTLDFFGLKSVVEFLFLNDKLDWNDFVDFTLINIAERIGDCAYITSDTIWQNFIKHFSNVNHCAYLSHQAIMKFYKNK